MQKEMERRSSSRRGVTVAARPTQPDAQTQAQAQVRALQQLHHEPRDSVSHSGDGRSVDSVQWSSEAAPSHTHHRARSDGHAAPAHSHAHSRDAVHPASSLASQTRSMRAFPSAAHAHTNHSRPAHQHVKCKTDFSEPADSLSMDPNYGGVDQHVFRAQLLMVSDTSARCTHYTHLINQTPTCISARGAQVRNACPAHAHRVSTSVRACCVCAGSISDLFAQDHVARVVVPICRWNRGPYLITRPLRHSTPSAPRLRAPVPVPSPSLSPPPTTTI